ncbi:MAG: type 4b pilus protein PilO2 [Alphaproteobacteria bacterium]|nr:type 4b pilus protein PilO2 [Alphaproteobacteria bacterium]
MLEDAKLLDDDIDGATAQRSWGTSITVDGVQYATSLFWQPLQNASDPFQEVEEASAGVLEGADLFCIKGGKAPQFGICVSQEGYKSGENVAAVALATALSNVGSFIAVFKTNEGWWYTCIRNDIILSDGDMLFLTEEEAKEQFMSMLAVPDWGKKIAPKEWGFEDTEDVDLAEILIRGAKSRLQKIKALRGTKLLLVVAISAVVGIWLISSLVDKLFLTPTVRPVVVPIKPKVAPKAAPVVEEPKPWEKVADPKTIMENCYQGITDLNQILPPGWNIGNIACSGTAVATSWVRSIGRVSWAKKALDKSGLNFSGYTFSSNGGNLSATLPISKAEEKMSPPKYTLVDLQNELNDKFQAIGVAISLSSDTEKTPAGKMYRRLNFSLKSEYNPLTWIEMLTKYSGLRIKMITYYPNDKTWQYEGAIYVL